MGINVTNNGSISWAQFVTATQAAKQRNSALAGNVNAGTNITAAAPQSNFAAPPKVAGNVYSMYGRISQEPSVEVKSRPMGGMFDAYA